MILKIRIQNKISGFFHQNNKYRKINQIVGSIKKFTNREIKINFFLDFKILIVSLRFNLDKAGRIINKAAAKHTSVEKGSPPIR